jgi:macrodomain Ter protein organizer (MatP/YcbG family)
MPGAPSTRLARHAVAVQRLNHRLFDAVDEFLDVYAQPSQVHQWVGDHLSGTVVGDLSAAVSLDHGNSAKVRAGACAGRLAPT